MSSITFQCKSCDADFELAVDLLIEKPGVLKCSNCAAKPAANRAHNLGLALEELMAAIAPLRVKYRFELTIESEALDEADEDEGVDGALTFANALSPDDDDDDDEEDEDDDDDDDEDGDDDEDDGDFDDMDEEEPDHEAETG